MVKKIVVIAVSISMLASCYCTIYAGQPVALSTEERQSVSDIHNVFRRAVDIISPSVVMIRMKKNIGGDRYFHESVEGLGSGCIINENGYIITNNHVVENTDEVEVILADGREFIGIEKYLDPDTDLAIVKIDSKGEKLPTANFGDSESTSVGDPVLAIGSPFGLSQTVTMGIISYKGRQTQILGQWGLEDFIQTDADINKGNSGGPLVNLYGEVIGINSNIFSPTGVSAGYGFAVPSNLAKYVTEQLISNKKVRRGYLGVKLLGTPLRDLRKYTDRQLLDLTEGNLDNAGYIKKMFNKMPDDLEGVFVARVENDTPAAKGKMKDFDIIIEYNGKKPDNSPDLRRQIAQTPPDSETKFKVWRNGKEQSLNVILGNRESVRETADLQERYLKDQQNNTPGFPDLPGFPDRFGQEPDYQFPTPDLTNRDKPKLGISVEQISPALAKKYGLAEANGKLKAVIVTAVNIGSVAEDVGISEGDMILSVNGKTVTSFYELKEIVTAADFSKGVVIKIRNKNGEKEINVTINDTL